MNINKQTNKQTNEININEYAYIAVTEEISQGTDILHTVQKTIALEEDDTEIC